jgi:putative flippase GtrA
MLQNNLRNILPDRTGLLRLASQGIKFGVVGLSAAALDFGVLQLCIGLGASPYWARFVSLAPAIVMTWYANRRLTFASGRSPSWREFMLYVSTALAGIGINFVLYWSALYMGLPVPVAFVIGTGTAAIFNFLRYRKLLS